jgi:hypothetical protein
VSVIVLVFLIPVTMLMVLLGMEKLEAKLLPRVDPVPADAPEE